MKMVQDILKSCDEGLCEIIVIGNNWSVLRCAIITSLPVMDYLESSSACSLGSTAPVIGPQAYLFRCMTMVMDGGQGDDSHRNTELVIVWKELQGNASEGR